MLIIHPAIREHIKYPIEKALPGTHTEGARLFAIFHAQMTTKGLLEIMWAQHAYVVYEIRKFDRNIEANPLEVGEHRDKMELWIQDVMGKLVDERDRMELEAIAETEKEEELSRLFIEEETREYMEELDRKLAIWIDYGEEIVEAYWASRPTRLAYEYILKEVEEFIQLGEHVIGTYLEGKTSTFTRKEVERQYQELSGVLNKGIEAFIEAREGSVSGAYAAFLVQAIGEYCILHEIRRHYACIDRQLGTRRCEMVIRELCENTAHEQRVCRAFPRNKETGIREITREKKIKFCRN